MNLYSPTRKGAKPANTSAEEQAMRQVVDGWARTRFGADIRIIHELQLGDRRADVVIVAPADLIVVEIKGPKDKLDERLPKQIQMFSFYAPEVWLAVHPKWKNSLAFRHSNVNRMVVDGDEVFDVSAIHRTDAVRDEMCCSRLLERLWTLETVRVARRSGIPIEYQPGKIIPLRQIKGMLARMLTGHEIMKQVCLELRSRPLTGMQSDEPLDMGGAAT